MENTTDNKNKPLPAAKMIDAYVEWLRAHFHAAHEAATFQPDSGELPNSCEELSAATTSRWMAFLAAARESGHNWKVTPPAVLFQHTVTDTPK